MTQASEIRAKLEAAANAEEQVRGLKAMHRQQATVSQLRALVKAQADALEAIEEAAGLKAWLGESVGKPIVVAKGKGGSKPRTTVVVAASDWHSAQLVNPKAVGGKNRHNPGIGQERAQKFSRDVVKRIRFQQGAFQIDDVVLWLGGDFMVGELHEIDSARSCDLSPLEEVAFVVEILEGVLRHLLSELDCPRIHVVCCWGNHGRTTEKPRSKSVHAYSYEQFVYTQLARQFASEPRLRFDVSESAFKLIDVAGFRIVAHHGDQKVVTGGGGIGGLAVPFRRRALTSILPDHEADFFLIGHFHRYSMFDVGGVNGSLVGVDEYAYNMGLRSERPAQIAFQVDHESRRIGTVMPIWVD